MELGADNVDSLAVCPSCGGQAEPEQDGEHHYHHCDCGYEFGWHRVTQTLVASGMKCAAGLPVPARVAATTQPVILQIGRRPDATSP